jgi:sugar phosphate isomerase/epimerase
MKRREFITSSAMAAAAMVTLPSFVVKRGTKHALGLQLYTLRSTIPQDPKGVLKKVSEFGYKQLEAYSYNEGKIFGLTYKEFCDYAKSLDMKVTSGHYGLDLIKGDIWKRAVDDAKANGQKFMVVPWINEDLRKSIDSYKRIIQDLNAAGEVCNKAGIRFGYHNHAFEFDTVEGQIPYDLMLKELDPKNVGMEMDIFWVVNAGKDPLQYFAQYPGRFEQWHVKDMDKADRNRNADVGTGSIDWKAIFAKAKLSGLKNFYVEQESYPGEPIDSAGKSAQYLKTIL